MPTNVLGLKRQDGERYVFIYDDVSMPQLLQALGRFAADPELSFEWRDAAELSCKARGREYTPPEQRRPPEISGARMRWNYSLFALAIVGCGVSAYFGNVFFALLTCNLSALFRLWISEDRLEKKPQ